MRRIEFAPEEFDVLCRGVRSALDRIVVNCLREHSALQYDVGQAGILGGVCQGYARRTGAYDHDLVGGIGQSRIAHNHESEWASSGSQA